jgi:hypothetical protein
MHLLMPGSPKRVGGRCVAVEFSRKTALGRAHLLLTVRSIHGGRLPLFACAGAGDGPGSDFPAPLG